MNNEMTENEMIKTKKTIGDFLYNSDEGQYLIDLLDTKINQCMMKSVKSDDVNEKFKASGGFEELEGLRGFFKECKDILNESHT
jgi:hypothetical protein